MATPCETFQSLLRELFQFDLADLDFGIYRLFRLKKDELEKFINDQIPQAVEKAFADLAEGDTSKLKAEVADLAQKIREELELDASLDDGSLNPRYDKAAIGKTVRLMVNDYEEKFKRLRHLLATQNQKDDVFNHLHAFFSRYYDRGDFMPRRFFGARPHYAVPYNGAETYFHWANKDQHYIKSGEAFRDYSFTVADILAGPARVRFALTKASLPPGDTKGDRRYFFPQITESTWDAPSRTFTITFHYRLPVEVEIKGAPVEENGATGEHSAPPAENGNGGNGKTAKPKKISGDKLQEKLLADAHAALVAACPEAGLADALCKVLNHEEVERDGKPPITYLAKRMRHFARRQTSDYFVHKNLAAFLREELDFYIKDQVVHVADLEGDFEGKRRMLRALRELAGQIIAFLHQLEEVQRRLFEKRKFVICTDYLCPVQNVPRALWKEICANKDQLKEWVALYALGQDGADESDLFAFKGKLTESFLETHPTLVVNTALFAEDFKWRLLETFDDIDSAVGGVAISSENYQALRLMQRHFAERVASIFIDPPYNTGQNDFDYKDCYQHSSWFCMMEGRLEAAKLLLAPDGLFFLQIGDQENHLARVLGERVFAERKNSVVVRRGVKNVQSQFEDIDQLSLGHDVIHVFARRQHARVSHLRQALDIEKPGKWDTFWRGTDRSTMRYRIFDQRPDTGQWRWEENRALQAKRNYEEYLCVWKDKKSLDEWYVENLQAGTDLDFVRSSEDKVVQYYVPPQNARLVSDNWLDITASGSWTDFAHEKSLDLLIRSFGWVVGKHGIAADFFAGSGSSAHAIVAMNRADGGTRKFLVVEMAGHFDSVLMPRMQRVIFTPEWNGLKPTRLPSKDEAARTPRLVKVLRLESYEDALHNLATDATMAASEAKAAAFQGALGAESYRLHYLARLPLEASPSMLQTSCLDHPFNYALEILTDDGAEARTVDLVETFNWLLGLDVQRVRRWEHEKREYLAVMGRDRASKRVLVVWRDATGLDPQAERAFLDKQVDALSKDAPFDRMLINGDSATPGFESLDAIFKQLMEAD